MNCRSLKTVKNLRINITKNVTHCFILNGKELPIHYSTIANVFHGIFCDINLRSFKISHFCRGYVVIEVPIKPYASKVLDLKLSSSL